MAKETKSLPILVVVGACGKQGGSVISAILNHSPPVFRLRGLSRDPSSDAAKALKDRGVEMIFANLDDRESLIFAFTGAFAAFCMTNFWEHMDPNREIYQATNLAFAARHCKISHIIWSTLEDTRLLGCTDESKLKEIPFDTDGFKVPHFDAKGQADKLFDGTPTTYLRTSFYFDNLIDPTYGMIFLDAEGHLTISLPLGSHKMPAIAVDDLGICVSKILQNPDYWVGKTIGVAGQFISGNDIAIALETVLGISCQYQTIDLDHFRALPFPGAIELGNMYQTYCEFEKEFCTNRILSIDSHQNLSLIKFLQSQPDRVKGVLF